MRRLLCLMPLVLLMCGTTQAASIVDYWPDEPEHIETYYMDSPSMFAEEGVLEGGISLYASVAPSYGVGTTNITLFEGVAAKLAYSQHYVYWRESQYVYAFAYGEGLSYTAGHFVGDGPVTVLRYNTYTSSGSQASWTSSTDSSFSLSPGNYLVWSDLGDYPTLYNRRASDYAQTACIILASFGLYYLFHHMWADIRQRYLGP